MPQYASSSDLPQRHYDVIVVGGGIMGSATAYYLLKYQPELRVCVVEKDMSYRRSSTVLSDGNTRVQFNLKENIQMSLYGLEVYQRFAEDMAVDGQAPELDFRQQGNLFLADEDGKEAAQAGVATQQALGAEVAWLEPEDIPPLYPYCKLEGVAGASFGPKDGTLSPYNLLMAYKNKAVAMGADYLEAEVGTLQSDKRQMTGVVLADGERLHSSTILASAGAWVGGLLEPLGVKLPIKGIKRQVYFIQTPMEVSQKLPALFLPLGNYLIHEAGGNFITGKALASDPESYDDFSCSRERFEEELWPVLASYIPELERLKVARMWAGLYAVNHFDGNGIIGEWPLLEGLYLANGFSGHGLQQCHAVGRYLSERILRRDISLDLSRLGAERILRERPLYENPRKLI